jgi:hypothetical protein
LRRGREKRMRRGKGKMGGWKRELKEGGKGIVWETGMGEGDMVGGKGGGNLSEAGGFRFGGVGMGK